MELDITQLADTDAFDYSASCAEMGQDAGRITWQNNIRDAGSLLDTEEKRQAARDHFREYGAWTREEIDAWSDAELNAITHQDIMSNVREAPAMLDGITFREESDGWYYEEESTPDFETGPFPSRSEAYHDACPQGREPRAESLEEIDWQEYEIQASAGRISSRIFGAEDGRFYFYMGF